VDISSLESDANVLKRELNTKSSTSIFSVKSVAARELYILVLEWDMTQLKYAT